jgi:hypothetical protein
MLGPVLHADFKTIGLVGAKGDEMHGSSSIRRAS